MNLTDLREELAEQADRMDSRHTDLLPGARRHARRTRAVRTTTAAASVAVVAFGSVLVAPNVLPADEPPTFDVPAAVPTSDPPRVPIRSVAHNGQRVVLAEGIVFSISGQSWRFEAAPQCRGCTKPWVTQDHIRPPTYGRQGAGFGPGPAGRFFAMDLVQGNASRVVYSVRMPGQPAATYEADVYRLPSAPRWTLAYVDYPTDLVIDQAFEENKLDVTFRAYDATGKYLPQVPPKSPK